MFKDYSKRGKGKVKKCSYEEQVQSNSEAKKQKDFQPLMIWLDKIDKITKILHLDFDVVTMRKHFKMYVSLKLNMTILNWYLDLHFHFFSIYIFIPVCIDICLCKRAWRPWREAHPLCPPWWTDLYLEALQALLEVQPRVTLSTSFP